MSSIEPASTNKADDDDDDDDGDEDDEGKELCRLWESVSIWSVLIWPEQTALGRPAHVPCICFLVYD